MSQLAETTTAQFDKSLADLKSQGMKGLILDMRNNGGGRLDTCVDIANRLVPKGPIVQRVDRDGTKEYEYSTLEKRDFPVVVLVNNYSASASEILAGALQDTKSATIVGVHSFGKASVQQTFPLSNGGALKVTVQKYLTPNGRDILGVGIQPDIKVIDTAWPLMPANPADAKTLTQDDIELLQAKLRLLGYSINSSETTIGSDTTAALKSFQGKKSLSVTGKPNQETIDALNLASYENTKDDLQLAKAVEAMKTQIQ
jgi:carboxyl-terminal processing protease